MRSIHHAAALPALIATSFTATAQLVSISGGGQILADPDPNFPLPDGVQAPFVQGINERQNLILGDDLTIDDLEQIIGVVTLPAGTAVSSHLLAFDPASQARVEDVLITFANPVLAVIVDDRTLADTHGLFGRPGLNYPGFVSLYGFEASTENFSVDGNTVTFSGSASTPGDRFRVLTAIPAPAGAVALAATGAVLALRRRPGTAAVSSAA